MRLLYNLPLVIDRFLSFRREATSLTVSLAQWLAFTHHEVVRAHLNIDESVSGKCRLARRRWSAAELACDLSHAN